MTLITAETPKNSPKKIMNFFALPGINTPAKPVTTPEFSAFWRELTEAEKDEIRYADLDAMAKELEALRA